MRVIVTGANGQLGRDAVVKLAAHHETHGFAREELDITDLDQTRRMVQSVKPDAIIHCAAYTAVDLAESEEDAAYRVNAVGTRNVALAAADVGAKMCYISTDYVFEGNASAPYREYDRTNPLTVYGKSKRAGEQLVQSLSAKYFIVRTSWVYGLHGNNFVKTMLKLARERNHLKVVDDQRGSPTYTVDLSNFLVQLIATDQFGIYHATNTGICSWFEFAQAIMEEAGASATVEPCTTEEFPKPAPRPRYSALDHLSIRTNGFRDLRPWREALKEFIAALRQQENNLPNSHP